MLTPVQYTSTEYKLVNKKYTCDESASFLQRKSYPTEEHGVDTALVLRH